MKKHFNVLMVVLGVMCVLCLAACNLNVILPDSDSGSGGGARRL